MPIFYNVGQSGSVGPTSGGKVWPINNLGQSGQQVVGPNPARTTLTFHNPGTVSNIYVYPVVAGDGTPMSPGVVTLGGTFVVWPGATVSLSGEIQTAWAAFAQSGGGNPLTVMESNLG